MVYQFINVIIVIIFNLIVKDGLKFIGQLEKKLGLLNITISHSRKQVFNDLCIEDELRFTKFITNVRHKWNLTYIVYNLVKTMNTALLLITTDGIHTVQNLINKNIICKFLFIQKIFENFYDHILYNNLICFHFFLLYFQ